MFPLIKKKSKKFMFPNCGPANITDVVSPTNVANPWMLANTDTAITNGTGDILVFLAMSNAIGATISTVATLSTNAETIPANAANKMIAHLVEETLLIIQSASHAGIPDSINSETTIIVPAMIINTFQFIAEEKTSLN